MNLYTKIIGYIGELKTRKIIKKSKPKKNYYVINNYKTYYKNESIQIDHIVITANKIICIETKNYKGKIYGKHNNLSWKIYYKNGKYKEIYNPILQNNKHIKVIESIIMYNTKIDNVVVFTGECDISKIQYIEIHNLTSLQNYIKKCKKETKTQNATELYNLLINSKKDISDKEHIQNLKNRNIK